MDLWVRSQDKTDLIKVYDVYIFEKRKIRANFQKGYGCTYTELGEYATEERALEILDEIQRHLVIINDKNDNLFYVYEMPKE